MSLVPLNPQTLAQHAKGTQEVAVSTYLERAKEWLATAVEVTGPEQIAAAKAEIATAAEATKQLNLSKEIRLDAQEMVRRAEYALGKAIRKGQEAGTILRHGDNQRTSGSTKSSMYDFTTRNEWHGGGADPGVVDIADASPEQFDAALDEAKAEGKLSRANVVRKIKAKAPAATRDSRAVELSSLAEQGYSSRQIADRLGIGFDAVRRIARDYDIDVPADKTMARTKRHDSAQIVENTVTALEGLAMGLSLIDYDDLDPAAAKEWAASLTESLRALNAFNRKIKETAQ